MWVMVWLLISHSEKMLNLKLRCSCKHIVRGKRSIFHSVILPKYSIACLGDIWFRALRMFFFAGSMLFNHAISLVNTWRPALPALYHVIRSSDLVVVWLGFWYLHYVALWWHQCIESFESMRRGYAGWLNENNDAIVYFSRRGVWSDRRWERAQEYVWMVWLPVSVCVSMVGLETTS